MDIKSVGNNSLVDLSGWVVVESPKETQLGEINRVTGRELDDVMQQIEGPAAQCSSLADRLKTEAVRLTIADASKERLDKALGADGADAESYAFLNVRCRAAWNAIADLESLTGNDIALVDSLEHVDVNEPSDKEKKVEKVRAMLKDAVEAQEQYAAALDEHAQTLPEGNPQRTELAAISRRARQRAENVIALWTQLKDAFAAAEELGLKTEEWTVLNRRGYVDEIYRQEAKDETLFNGNGALAGKFRELRGTFGGKSLASVRASIANVFRRQVADLGLPVCIQNIKQFATTDSPVVHAVLDKPVKAAEDIFKKYKEALSKLVDACDRAVAQPNERPQAEKAANDAKKAADQLVKGLRRLDEKLKRNFPIERNLAEALGKYYLRGELNWRIDGILSAFGRRSLQGVQRALTAEDLAAVMVGRTPYSSAVESMIWNPGGNYGNDLDGMDLIDEQTLGSGQFNTVKLCMFRTPAGETVERVFRPEFGAVSSQQCGAIGHFLVSKSSFVGGFVINNAAQNLTKFFNCKDIFPQTMFGTLHGEPGMFLEKAPGRAGGDYRGFGVNFSRHNEFKDMDYAKRRQVCAEVSRKLNWLQWMDVLSGQYDRHLNNVMIGVGTDGETSVKGIDNDECFPDCDIGNGRYVFKNRKEAKMFLARMLDAKAVESISQSKLKSFADSSLDAETKRLFQNDDGWNDGVVLDIRDLDGISQGKIKRLYKSFDPPDHIDAELLDTLKDKSKNLYEYGLMLKDSGLSDRQVIAAKARLIFARNWASDEILCRKVEPDGWMANLDRMSGFTANLFDRVKFKLYMRLDQA